MQSFLETRGYAAIFLLTVLESACVPVPSEVTLGLGGALASGATIAGTKGDLHLGLVIAVGILGSVVGSLLAYLVGRVGGRPLVERFGRYLLVTDRDLDRAHDWFARRGEPAVLIGRVVPFVRTFISLPAGLARMPVGRFTVFTTIGVAVWVTLLSCIGYALGGSWNSMTRAFGLAGYVIGAIVMVSIATILALRYRARRRRRVPGG